MGLTGRLLADLSQGLLEGQRRPTHFEIADAEVTLKKTTALFVDLTQLLYAVKVSPELLLGRRVVEHATVRSFLESGDPMGELEIEDRCIRNVVDSFTMDQVIQLAINRVMSAKRQWKVACNSVGITCPLRSVFLLLDGDSPWAKCSTVKKRVASKQSCVTNKLASMLSSEEEGDGIQAAREEVSKNVASKMSRSPVACPHDPAVYEGSVRSFLQRRANQHRVAAEMAQLLASSQLPLLQETSLYLVMGSSKETPSGRFVKVCGSYKHPCESLLRECFPYKEADLLIPFIWTKISSCETGACVLSKDSDALVSLLAVADPKLSLVAKAKEVPSRSAVLPGSVAIRTVPGLSADPRRQLEAMLHLTMGGTDYVETYPRCGTASILKGLEKMDGVRSMFSNVQFASWSDLGASPPPGSGADETARFALSTLTGQGSRQLALLKDLVRSREDCFPVRLVNAVYLVRHDRDRDARVREWYAKQCPADVDKAMTLAQRRHFDNEAFTSCFSQAMRRRLFFLSMMSDSRTCMENDMQESPELSAKCGYDFHRDFSYVERMAILTSRA